VTSWPQTYTSSVTADTAVTTTTETVVATLSGVNAPGPGATIRLTGTVQMTYGTATTAMTPRIRRGTDATGTLVGEGNPLTGAAGNTAPTTLEVVDTPGEVANQSYVLTVQQTAATGNGSVLQATLNAIVKS